MIAELRAEEFSDFFKEVHGVPPFPWQRRLLERIVEKGWPLALDIPTGAGKTAAIDVAVFHLALEAARGAERRSPVRILFVVDRRLIVDDAHRRALHIAKLLSSAKDGVLKRVADRLRLLAEVDTPLAVARLRGGMPKEPDWARTPAQPTVVVSTVDQIGSRLLFRGYGVSDTMKPVHAGLLGTDALLLLDEAHLSQPFVQTARDARIFQTAPWSENTAPAPFDVVTLSATQTVDDPPDRQDDQPFEISDDDRAEPTLGRRLAVAKPAELIEAQAAAGDTAFVEQFATKALELAQSEDMRVVAIVVNRVSRARAIFDTLLHRGIRAFSAPQADDHGPPTPQAALLTGRVRDLDRDDILAGLLPLIRSSPQRRGPDSLFIVATQCVEAGADLDFDALVTEIAPLDCLRQRFGRLNRMGRDIAAQAAIIAASDQLAKGAKPDPIYGEALRQTWTLLAAKGQPQGKGKGRFIDFGIAHSISWCPRDEALTAYLAPRKNAPVLLPSAVDLWSRTSPVPAVDPEVPLYLHGPESGIGDVEIVWRADLDDKSADDWIKRVEVCPPSALEAISVPLTEARRWLRNVASGDIADVEIARGDDERAGESGRTALRWRGIENAGTDFALAHELRPGDIIVVPASRGGCDRWGWAPRSKVAVPDIACKANLQQRGRDILRLNRVSPDLAFDEEGNVASIAEMRDWSDRELVNKFAMHFQDGGQVYSSGRDRVFRSRDGTPLAIERKRKIREHRERDDSAGDAVTEDDESLRSFRQRPVLLRDHSQGVETFARRFAEQAGLPAKLVEDLALAAFLHDAGKAHPEFKRFLYGGDELAARGAPDLAKSAKLPNGAQAWEDARHRSGLPRGARHEVASLRFAEAHTRFGSAHDSDLVLWLIGTHHGYGRPFFAAPERDWPGEGTVFATDLGDGGTVAKPARSLADLTATWIDLFVRLKRRYGPWGLPRLEAIVRLADHRRSQSEQEDDRP